MNALSIEDAFRSAIEGADLPPPDEVIADGVLHRFPTSTKRGDSNGWYVLFADPPVAGAFGCWRTGITRNWHARASRPLSVGEYELRAQRVAFARAQRAEDARRRHTEAAAGAALLWSIATPAPDEHPYLRAKGVKAHGLRVDSVNNLLVPVFDAGGALSSIQRIYPNGVKRFMIGGKVAGCWHLLGTIPSTPRATIVVAEGFASAATLHEATGYAVVVALSAGNLPAVARALRHMYPGARIVVAADDDWKTDGNPGLAWATEAARAIGGALAVPNFDGLPRGVKDTDFNDWMRLRRAVGGFGGAA